MKKKEKLISLTKAEKYMVNDLYTMIISSASDPVEMMKTLSRTLREVIGAEEIILFEGTIRGDKPFTMVSQVHHDKSNLLAFERLARAFNTGDTNIRQYDVNAQGVQKEVLEATGYDDVMVVPVLANSHIIGCMYVYGSLDKSIHDQLERLMNSIRPLIGVILQNYQLFNSMDLLLKERTKVLNKVNRELANLIYTVPDLILITDRKLHLYNIFNYQKDSYYFESVKIGRNFSSFISTKQLRVKQGYIDNLDDGDMVTFMEEVVSGGTTNYLENRVKRTGDRYLHIIRNISELVTAEQQIDFMNKYDQLTGLYNRGSFYKILEQLEKSQVCMSILVVDMNGLKLLNETLGFSEGDRYLKLLAQSCKKILPSNGTLSRVGADEIAFVIPEGTMTEIQRIRKDLNNEVKKLNKTSLNKFPLSISQGYYIEEETKGYEHVFTMAEKDLNQDKLLHAESKKSAIVRTLTKAMEARDFITEGHADRMEKLLERFADEMGVDSSMRVRLRLFGKFHDIGKVGIRDSILFKPGKLTEEEMNEMKKHSEIGYRIALTAADLHSVADLILKHHERYDGSGYPTGLSKEEIPIECRILAIVDAFDAMTNNRPYRDAMTQEAAIDELKKYSGSQFDPELVTFFLTKILGL